MKRKYRNEKVKVGDWVYVGDYMYDSKCKYKVLGIEKDRVRIIVEVKDNDEDRPIINGWPTETKKTDCKLPSGTLGWFVRSWEKVKKRCLNIE